MNLYRLDYHEGHTVSPVIGPVMRDYLSRNWRQTREDAQRYAAERGSDVVISRIRGAGTMRPVARVSPDGRVRRPY